jgi:hypothetical protein
MPGACGKTCGSNVGKTGNCGKMRGIGEIST